MIRLHALLYMSYSIGHIVYVIYPIGHIAMGYIMVEENKFRTRSIIIELFI